MEHIDTLLGMMTVEEKIGQLNMVAPFLEVADSNELGDLDEGIRTGHIGSVLKLWDADEIRAVQHLAVEESRLGIPLLVGLDIIHGYHTIFPGSAGRSLPVRS